MYRHASHSNELHSPAGCEPAASEAAYGVYTQMQSQIPALTLRLIAGS